MSRGAAGPVASLRGRGAGTLRFYAFPGGSQRPADRDPERGGWAVRTRAAVHRYTLTHLYAHSHTPAVLPALRTVSQGKGRKKKKTTPQPPVSFVAFFFGTIKVKLIDSYH